jgi:DNA gyrase subunit B
MEPVTQYSAASIRTVGTLEHVRRQAAMYVGPLPNPGVLNRLIEDALCLSADEAACGRCTEIAVAVHPSGIVTIRDNGPGLQVEPDEHARVPAEMLFTVIGTCRAAKISKVAAACCQFGLAVVNALSEWLRVRVFRDGGCWFQEYRAGVPQFPFRRERDADESGLELSFRPDTSILGALTFDAAALAGWFPSVGVRFGALEYRPVHADMPALLHFTDVGPHPDTANLTSLR